MTQSKSKKTLETAFLDAAGQGRNAEVKSCLEQGANVHAKDEQALKCAVLDGNAALISLLIEHGADPGKDDNSQLKTALTFGQTDVFAALLPYVEVTTETLGKMLEAAAMDGITGIVQTIVEHADDAIQNDLKPAVSMTLYRAAEGLSEDIVAYLLDQGVDATGDDGAPLGIAAKNGYIEIAQRLLAAGADITAGDNIAPRNAALGGKLDMLALLAEQGANMNVNGEEPLRFAAKGGHVAVISHLVENHGADVTARDNEALLEALTGNHPEALRYLLDKGGRLRMEQLRDAAFESRATGKPINEAMAVYEEHAAKLRKEVAFAGEKGRFDAARRKLKNLNSRRI